MTGRHRALIVEDECLIAEELDEILKSISCDSIIVDNKREALAVLQSEKVCFILLDLEIKCEPDSIKGHTEHGSSLLREIRRTHADHPGLCYWLPILIVSGFAREFPAAIEVMKDGANDFIQKPFKARAVSDAVRRELERSGRVTHEVCGPRPMVRSLSTTEGAVLSIPGDRVRRRTRVMVGSRPIMLPSSSLKVLLHLMVAHEVHAWVHKRALGATDEQGFKGISVLREALKPALADGADIIINDHHGQYRFADNVVVAECNAEKLAMIGDKEIADLSLSMSHLLQRRP